MRPYQTSDWPKVADLLAIYPIRPLASHGRWPDQALSALFLARVATLLAEARTATWVACSGEAVTGLAAMTTLPWDSEQIGMAAARLDLLAVSGTCSDQREMKQALLSAVLHSAAEQGIRHLSARIDAADLAGLHALEMSGFHTVDGILTFASVLDGRLTVETSGGIRIRLARPADSESVAELAGRAFFHDRFHADPAIPFDRASALHETWARNSCAGVAADAVVLAEDEQGVLGFVTCRVQRDTKQYLGELVGTIVLVATAERARRKGVARAITFVALDWFRQQGVAIVEVGTQLRNIPAARLYEHCGFRLVGSSISLRKLL